MNATILIIDDQVTVYKSLARNFTYLGYQTLHAQTGQAALDLLARRPVHIVLLDIMLGKESGMDLLDRIVQRRQDLPVIMITGYGTIGTAVQSIKVGAFDYVTKPLDFEKLAELVEHALKASMPAEQSRAAATSAGSHPMRLTTRNSKLLKLWEKAQKLAATDLPILISGEDGTGKEILADTLHLASARKAQPIIKINCAAFPETLLDNELFGHEKGAYTGADSGFKGVFERAHGSTLFLDEIGDMPLTIQAKILRALQNREIRRIGGEQTITVDVRFIAATNKNLQELITQKAFRKDLFYRLNAAVLHVPPLRNRKDDIPLLVNEFAAEYARIHAAPLKTVSPAVLDAFVDYDWPGNVRELKNTVNYALAIAARAVIELDDLPPNLPPGEPLGELVGEPDNLREDLEKNLILKMLQKTNFNKKQTAKMLKMSRNTLYNKLDKYGISASK